MRSESLNEEEKMKIIVNGDESDQQVADLKRILKNATEIELKITLNEKTKLENEIARETKYVALATYIHNLIDLICKRLPHLKESYVQTTPYHDLKDCRANWRLVDWIHAFPTDETRIEFLLYKDTFLYIAGELTREYWRCDGVPKEYCSTALDISKDDYSVDESIALLQKFKELV